jgi:hypothetical protein
MTSQAYSDRLEFVQNLLVTEGIAKREIILPLYPAKSNDDECAVVSAVQANLNLN